MQTCRMGLLLLLFFSCKNTRSGNPEVRDTLPALRRDSSVQQSMIDEKSVTRRQKDTVLYISIEDISEEGSEVKASYVKDTLRNATWEIYGESGKAVIVYTFSGDGRIHVFDKHAIYKVSLGNVKSDKDMRWDSVTYELDTNGVLLSKLKDTDIVKVFPYFKQNVPMILNR